MDQFVLVRSNTGELSTSRPLLFGVTQSSVLGPLLHVLYTAELEQVCTRHGMRLHQYADDSQLYNHVTVSDIAVTVQCIAACVSEVNHGMRTSRLRLNPANVAGFVLATDKCRHNWHSNICSVCVFVYVRSIPEYWQAYHAIYYISSLFVTAHDGWLAATAPATATACTIYIDR